MCRSRGGTLGICYAVPGDRIEDREWLQTLIARSAEGATSAEDARSEVTPPLKALV
jgi:hypothetical protein